MKVGITSLMGIALIGSVLLSGCANIANANINQEPVDFCGTADRWLSEREQKVEKAEKEYYDESRHKYVIPADSSTSDDIYEISVDTPNRNYLNIVYATGDAIMQKILGYDIKYNVSANEMYDKLVSEYQDEIAKIDTKGNFLGSCKVEPVFGTEPKQFNCIYNDTIQTVIITLSLDNENKVTDAKLEVVQ